MRTYKTLNMRLTISIMIFAGIALTSWSAIMTIGIDKL